jgi:hypothetical protein
MENLYLKWIDYKTNKKYIIGALCFDRAKHKYYFKINRASIKKAEEHGFSMAFLPFPDKEDIIESDTLFAFFKVRVPKIEKMSDETIKEMLDDYGMKEFDEFEYLKKTKGDILIDDFILEEEKD